MANIYLGLPGGEVLLPALNWNAGGDLEPPVGYEKNVDVATMLDGSKRVNVRALHSRTFELEWALLPVASIQALTALAELNCALRFQHNWLDSTWRWVYVESFEWSAIQSTQAGTAQYRATMTLAETP